MQRIILPLVFLTLFIIIITFVMFYQQKRTTLGTFCDTTEKLFFTSATFPKDQFIDILDNVTSRKISYRSELINKIEEICLSEEYPYKKIKINELYLEYKIHTLTINNKSKKQIYQFFYTFFDIRNILFFISLLLLSLILGSSYFLFFFKNDNRNSKLKLNYIFLSSILFILYCSLITVIKYNPKPHWQGIIVLSLATFPFLFRLISNCIKSLKQNS